jgi:hypothetical protein
MTRMMKIPQDKPNLNPKKRLKEQRQDTMQEAHGGHLKDVGKD